MSATTEFNVEMSCGGCANAVSNVLKKMPGVENVQCDVKTKKVVVTGSAKPEEMLAAIQKTGKKASLVA